MSTFIDKVDWNKKHIMKCYTKEISSDEAPLDKSNLKFKDADRKELMDEHKEIDKHGWLIQELRKDIEPWLTSIFQSDHFSVLLGTGLTSAVTGIADTKNQGMSSVEFGGDYKGTIKKYSEKLAKEGNRGGPNIEDDFNASFRLLEGYEITGETKKHTELLSQINVKINEFIKGISETEKGFLDKRNDEKGIEAVRKLQSFLISFSARSASRERLNIFTTNYDRFIEYGLDTAGILSIDRFVGKIKPKLRTTKLDLDYHYNPPGIRGEPRYVEGVVKLTKLHGSIDWHFEGDDIIRVNTSFGGIATIAEGKPDDKKAKDLLVIFPNSAKGVDTVLFPYSELFRDFASGICQPNSVIVTYGYGFGDSHINRIISDMLSLPSTHLVIISYDKKENKEFWVSRERVKKFYSEHNSDQITLLIGEHFADFSILVDYYLPKAAIDRIQSKALRTKAERYGTGNKPIKEGSNE